MRIRIALVALLAAAALAAPVAGCSSPSPPNGAKANPASSVQVVLKNIAVDPTQVNLTAGGTVTFLNEDTVAHRIVDDGERTTPGCSSPDRAPRRRSRRPGRSRSTA